MSVSESIQSTKSEVRRAKKCRTSLFVLGFSSPAFRAHRATSATIAQLVSNFADLVIPRLFATMTEVAQSSFLSPFSARRETIGQVAAGAKRGEALEVNAMTTATELTKKKCVSCET